MASIDKLERVEEERHRVASELLDIADSIKENYEIINWIYELAEKIDGRK